MTNGDPNGSSGHGSGGDGGDVAIMKYGSSDTLDDVEDDEINEFSGNIKRRERTVRNRACLSDSSSSESVVFDLTVSNE